MIVIRSHLGGKQERSVNRAQLIRATYQFDYGLLVLTLVKEITTACKRRDVNESERSWWSLRKEPALPLTSSQARELFGRAAGAN